MFASNPGELRFEAIAVPDGKTVRTALPSDHDRARYGVCWLTVTDPVLTGNKLAPLALRYPYIRRNRHINRRAVNAHRLPTSGGGIT